MCAEFVREGASLADIGTDHAYLPIRLIKSGKIRQAVAADVNPGPLERAAENIRKNFLEEKITTLLSDGLDNIPPGSVTDIVIAGMGGELILSIVERCAWLRHGGIKGASPGAGLSPEGRSARPEREKINLILQPMTKCETLISGLYRAGFEIVSQKTVREGAKIYTAMLVSYCGDEREMPPAFCYTGKLDATADTDAEYIARLLGRLKKSAAGNSGLLNVITEIELQRTGPAN